MTSLFNNVTIQEIESSAFSWTQQGSCYNVFGLMLQLKAAQSSTTVRISFAILIPVLAFSLHGVKLNDCFPAYLTQDRINLA